MKCNRKWIMIAILATAVLGWGHNVSAANEEASLKFGYVDFQRALETVDEGKQAKEKLKADVASKQKELSAAQEELKKLKEDLDKQRLILSADALREKEQNFQKRVMEIQEKMNSYKMEIQTKEMEVTSRILSQLKSLVQQVGKDEGYTMILEKSQEIVLYSPMNADLTDRLIKLYNETAKKKK